MTRHTWRTMPMKESMTQQATDLGQAMLLVIALIAILVAVPVAISVLAVGQVSTSENAALTVQAKQAAQAGISDYINNVQADSTYTKYCSTGMTSGATQWACPGSTVSAPTLTNPAFVNSPTLAGKWYSDGSTMRGVANGTPSYRYVVNSPNTAIPAQVLIYSIGQAGTAAGQHVSATEEAALTVCASGCLYPTKGVSCIKVPTNALSAKIIAYGAKGGGGGPDAAGGVGAMLTATVPVTAGDTLDLYPGQPGQAGNPQLLNLLDLLAGAGGAGGVPLSGPCLFPQTYSPPDLGGGNGALPGGLADVLTDGGGGGGGATMVFDATATTNNMVAVAGGGGGGGAGDSSQRVGQHDLTNNRGGRGRIGVPVSSWGGNGERDGHQRDYGQIGGRGRESERRICRVGTMCTHVVDLRDRLGRTLLVDLQGADAVRSTGRTREVDLIAVRGVGARAHGT